jgi:Iodothyronine deiodinase
MWFISILLVGCGSSSRSTAASPGSGASVLKPAGALVTDCFDFPNRPFRPNNHAEVGLRLTSGDAAVDFALPDVGGGAVRLSDLLAKKPVLLVQGSWTCPRFQEERDGIDKIAEKYGKDVEVVVVYNVEAHPSGGQPSPYHGRPKPHEFSDRGQSRNQDERARSAAQIAEGASFDVLVDTFDAGRANPVWCTYGTCPSCSWLIGQDGSIAAAHEWHDTPSMMGSIDALLAKR